MSTMACIKYEDKYFGQSSDGYPKDVLTSLREMWKSALEKPEPERFLKLGLYEDFWQTVDSLDADYTYNITTEGKEMLVEVASRSDREELRMEIEQDCPQWEFSKLLQQSVIFIPKFYGRYLFKVELSGFGNNPSQAWDDAVEGFMQDAGPTPEEYEYEEEEV